MTTPEGYKPYTGSSAAVGAKATELLAQDYGYTEETTIDGKQLLFVVEIHTWYGANPDKPPKPHKGVTVYEKLDSAPPDMASSSMALSAPMPAFSNATINEAVLPTVAIGLGYLILKQIGNKR